MEIEVVADEGDKVGENPLWHPTEKALYWTDIPRGRLRRYDPAAGTHTTVYESGEELGGFTIQADGSLLLFMDGGAVRTLRDGAVETLIESVPDGENARFNDVIADPEGRVFCGIMAYDNAPRSLYRLDTDGTITQILDGIGCSNGMDFTPDGTGLYYTDSLPGEIYLFDYDRATGALSGQRVFRKFPREEGVPDGLTLDAEGNVWSAFFFGGCIRCFSPDGEEIRRIELPAKQMTSLAFGGEDLEDLYLTSGGGDKKDENGEKAGALFRIRPGVKGRPGFCSRVGL